MAIFVYVQQFVLDWMISLCNGLIVNCYAKGHYLLQEENVVLATWLYVPVHLSLYVSRDLLGLFPIVF